MYNQGHKVKGIQEYASSKENVGERNTLSEGTGTYTSHLRDRAWACSPPASGVASVGAEGPVSSPDK